MTNLFAPIKDSQTLSQKIERKIEQAIRDKKLPAGSKLPTEHELCKMFAVSRTALREALRRLSARGLIDIKKGSGMYVSDYNIKDAISSLLLYYDLKFDHNLILHINQARLMFEPEIAKLAATNRSKQNLKDIRKIIDDLIKCDGDHIQAEADIINAFHAKITEITCNSFVIITMEPIFSLIPRMRNFIYANVEGERDIRVKFYERIYKALLNSEGDIAHKAMSELIEHTNETYIQKLQKYNME
ncbi:MAG: GntR family transcriptional regulator [Bacteroidetes bacterium 4572_117]|nr:MAG: GntR family transcriptional regulator [Bacteroidetes bacterium 4572_117]